MIQKAVDWNLQEKKLTLDDLNWKRFIERILDWYQTQGKSRGSRGVDMQPRIIPKISLMTWGTGTPRLASHGAGLHSLPCRHRWSGTPDSGPESTVLTSELQPSIATSTANDRELPKVPTIPGWAPLTSWHLDHISLSWLQEGTG